MTMPDFSWLCMYSLTGCPAHRRCPIETVDEWMKKWVPSSIVSVTLAIIMSGQGGCPGELPSELGFELAWPLAYQTGKGTSRAFWAEGMAWARRREQETPWRVWKIPGLVFQPQHCGHFGQDNSSGVAFCALSCIYQHFWPKAAPPPIVTTEKGFQTQPNVPPQGRGVTPWLRTMAQGSSAMLVFRYKVRSGRNGSQWSRWGRTWSVKGRIWGLHAVGRTVPCGEHWKCFPREKDWSQLEDWSEW